MKITRIIKGLLLTLLLALPLYSQERNSDPKTSEAAVRESQVREEEVLQEIRSLKNHDWAGEYYYGDGLGVNVRLVLAPVKGFVFTWHGCLGLYDLNYGNVSFTDGKVKLLFEYPNVREGFQGIVPEFLPIRWGKRHYLIPSDEVVHFTNAINAGTEPGVHRAFSQEFLLREGDENLPVSGLPSIPAEFLRYILAKPLEARIRSVDEIHVSGKVRITTVTIDAGSKNGLKQGMELYVQKPSKAFESATITSVAEHSASAIIEQFEPDASTPVPALEWELSTKLCVDCTE